MKIIEIESHPFDEILYQSAASGGGSEILRLPLFRARADRLPGDVTALLIASDLQGVAPSLDGGPAILLGERLAEHVQTLELPELARLGVVLCGDLFSAPDARTRGASGDVTRVWEAFASVAEWVIGVQGNHDDYSRDFWRLTQQNCSLLDGSGVRYGSVSVGGVGLIAGNPNKHGRRTQEEQERLLRSVLRERPDVVLLHEGPPGAVREQRGTAFVGDVLAGFEGLVVCGHCHWSSPLAMVGKAQVLNVDARAVIVTR